MANRKRRKRVDVDEVTGSIVDQATEEGLRKNTGEDGKNPAAVALGRLGGLKGGKARARKLSAEERSAIARKAAEARWRHNQD